MLEAAVEDRLKTKLERQGFKVLKLRTPGTSGTKDRMILWPKYYPRPPTFVEIKRPGEEPRPLQAAVADDWRARGVDVRKRVSTYEEVDALVSQLLEELGWLNRSLLRHLSGPAKSR